MALGRPRAGVCERRQARAGTRSSAAREGREPEREQGMIHVYIAGPISKDPLGGTREAVLEARFLDSQGFACFVPHLSVLSEMIAPREYEEWMALDFAWLAKCAALLRLPGESQGADREV